jgi:hypothetical protein
MPPAAQRQALLLTARVRVLSCGGETSALRACTWTGKQRMPSWQLPMPLQTV